MTLIVTIGVVLFLSGINKRTTTSEQSQVRFAVATGAIVSALPLIAEANNYWDDSKIKVEVLGFTSGRNAAQALLGGGAELTTMADFPFILSPLLATQSIPWHLISFILVFVAKLAGASEGLGYRLAIAYQTSR